jgi:hypothetical protein
MEYLMELCKVGDITVTASFLRIYTAIEGKQAQALTVELSSMEVYFDPHTTSVPTDGETLLLTAQKLATILTKE